MDIKSELPFDIPLKEIILQPGILEKAPELCRNLGKRGFVVCDKNTVNFVNIPLEKRVLPASYKPTLALAEEISKTETDFFVAVGSGSLNDLVKYAAAIAGKPYIVFATAASMNGYVSTSSSLVDESGFKKSFLAKPPQAAYFDLEVIKSAPARLTNSGIGDSICRSTCEADALLSHHYLGTPSYVELFELIRTYEERIFDDIEALCKTLVFSGIAMLLSGSSSPASQGEHMLAHYMELMQADAPQSYHGEQIAVTTITMAKLQQQVLENPKMPAYNRDEIIAHFGTEFGEYCIKQTEKKYSHLASKNFTDIKFEKPQPEKIEAKLKSIGAPLAAKDIGWDENKYQDAQKFARYTRDRLTFLDLI
jgi:glycerol-1-phosphate dehydrogenase [NAD(P)+]